MVLAETAETEEKEAERQELPGMGLSYIQTEEQTEHGLRVGYSNYNALNQLGIFNIRTKNADLYYVLVYPEEVYQNEKEEDHFVSRFLVNYTDMKYKEEVNGEYHYTYLNLASALQEEDYPADEWVELMEIVPLCEKIADSIEYQDLEIGALTFDSLNLDGEQVTDAIFGEKKITVVNVWATYCNPCINEMPELAAWEKEMSEDAQILYICSDIFTDDSENIPLAGQIADKAGINRKNVIYNLPGTCTDVMERVTGVPTTFFVDQNGRMLEDTVVGAAVYQYKAILKKYLEEAGDE